MALFNKKKKTTFNEEGSSAQLNPQVLAVNDTPTLTQEIDSIVKTTDSIAIVSGEAEQIEDAERLQQIKEGILHSYDFARRKITTQFQEVINSGTYIENQFLAVQIAMKNFEKGWDVKMVESTISRFFDAIPEQIAIGKVVYFTNQFTIEPIIYVNKILPSWKITPNFAALVNAITWEEIVDKLVKAGEMLSDGKEVIRELIEALTINLENGYYIKMSRFIVMQISNVNKGRIVLFSNDTLTKLNEVYLKFQKVDKKSMIEKTDASEHFMRTKENIENGFLMEDMKVEKAKEVQFSPKDLKEDMHEDAFAEQVTQEVDVDVQLLTKDGVKVKGKKAKEVVKEVEEPAMVEEVVEKSSKKDKKAKSKIATAKPAVKKVEVKPTTKNTVKKVVAKPAVKKVVAKPTVKKVKTDDSFGITFDEPKSKAKSTTKKAKKK